VRDGDEGDGPSSSSRWKETERRTTRGTAPRRRPVEKRETATRGTAPRRRHVEKDNEGDSWPPRRQCWKQRHGDEGDGPSSSCVEGREGRRGGQPLVVVVLKRERETDDDGPSPSSYIASTVSTRKKKKKTAGAPFVPALASSNVAAVDERGRVLRGKLIEVQIGVTLMWQVT
jgi:hypothetical protein